MTSGDRDALEALTRRLEHVEGTARLVARTIDDRDTSNALWGLATTIEEAANRLDAIVNPKAEPAT